MPGPMGVVLPMPSQRHGRDAIVVMAVVVCQCRHGGVVIIMAVVEVALSCQAQDARGSVAKVGSSSSCLEGCDSELVVWITKVLRDLVKISTHLVLYSYTFLNLALMNLYGVMVWCVW